MRYSVLEPRGNSSTWRILDDRGGVVFSGLSRECEELLDLADRRESAGRQPNLPVKDCLLAATKSGEIAVPDCGPANRFSGDEQIAGNLNRSGCNLWASLKPPQNARR
jgi:hypothetical protein